MMKKILRAGIVGYGYMGEIRRRVIESNDRMELAGITETDKDVRAKIQGPQVFETFEELLDRDLDIVFVCTPNRFSPEICIESLKRGKHVFCEKPPGKNIDDLKRIVKEEKGSLKLMFGFNHRFHPGVIKARSLVNKNMLGRIIGIRGVYGKSGGINFRDSWRNKKEISGGGILLDQGIHMLDLFLYLCGDFEHVKCFTDNTFWGFDIEDNAFLILKNNKGQSAFLHSSATLWKHTFEMNIILENGYIIVNGLLSKTGSYGREKLIIGRRQFEDEAEALGNPMEEIVYFDRDLSWEQEVSEFVRCIEHDEKVTISSSEDALKVMSLIEKAYLDAKNQ